MANIQAQVQLYSDEFIEGFEQRNSKLGATVTRQGIVKGNQYTFLVVGSNGQVAKTRGTNGKIPVQTDDETQVTVTLAEYHDKRQKTNFNVFAGQSDQRRIMQLNSMAVINRTQDLQILDELANCTQTVSNTAATASLEMVLTAKTGLTNNEVPNDGNISAVITAGFEADLMKLPEFTSADYVTDKKLEKAPTEFNWMGVHFIVSSLITGVGTASELCYMYHKSAIGYGIDRQGISVHGGYNDEEDYYWTRTSFFANPKLIQNEGIVLMKHIGTTYALDTVTA